MRTPLLLYGLALVVRAAAHLALPGPGLPRFVLLRGRRARTSTPGQGFNVDFIWIFPEVGGKIPADPDPADPVERPLDAAGVDRPGAVPRRSSATSAWASALPFALIGAIAAPLTWAIARDAGAPAVRRGRRRGPRRDPGCCRPCSWPSPTTSRSTSRSSSASLWMAARAVYAARAPGRSFVLAGLLAGLATLARNDGLLVLVVARARLPVGSLAGLALGRRAASRPIPFAAAVGVRRGLRAGHGAVVGAPAGRLRLALAVDRVGQGPVHPRHRGVEQHHHPGDPGPPARDGHRPADR